MPLTLSQIHSIFVLNGKLKSTLHSTKGYSLQDVPNPRLRRNVRDLRTDRRTNRGTENPLLERQRRISRDLMRIYPVVYFNVGQTGAGAIISVAVLVRPFISLSVYKAASSLFCGKWFSGLLTPSQSGIW